MQNPDLVRLRHLHDAAKLATEMIQGHTREDLTPNSTLARERHLPCTASRF
jgi:hypothetical protein